MTIRTVNVAALKKVKNSVIGNPTAKLALAKDEAFVELLVECINDPVPFLEESQGSQDDIRIEAAHVIASLSYGSSDALRTLLRVNAHQAFLYAIANFQPSESTALKAAFARALRALSVAIADVVGPSQWGLRNDSADLRNEAKVALDHMFQLEALDTYLPLLTDASNQVSTSIAELLGSTVRGQSHRTAVSEWLPQAERRKEVKGKRGWEKTEGVNAPNGLGGWVASKLVALLRKRDSKLQQAVLSALASLAKDNPVVALRLVKSPGDGEAPLSLVLSFCRTRSADLQLAACLCATDISRACTGFLNLPDHPAAPTIVHVLDRLISSESETPQTRTKACFILYNLVADHKDLCKFAFDRGSLDRLGILVKSITPSEKTVEWEEDEPESISCLREAALTTIGAMSLFDNDIRCHVTDGLRLIPCIQTSLSSPHVGVRFAACHCVRALSRAVAVLRTNIVDSGVGVDVFKIFQRRDEDRRVTFAASAVVCNLVADCSPLRPVLLEQGVVARLVDLIESGESGLRLNALWALKNLLYKSSSETKRAVMSRVGWTELANLLMNPDAAVQEQAYHVVRHIADGEDDVEMVFQELGNDVLLGILANGLDSENEDVLQQAICVLANLANGPMHTGSILANARILNSLCSALLDARVEIRRPAVSCVLELVRAHQHRHRELRAAGIVSTLRHMCESTGTGGGAGVGGGVSASPTRRYMSSAHLGFEDDQEVKEKARQALSWLEHSGFGLDPLE